MVGYFLYFQLSTSLLLYCMQEIWMWRRKYIFLFPFFSALPETRTHALMRTTPCPLPTEQQPRIENECFSCVLFGMKCTLFPGIENTCFYIQASKYSPKSGSSWSQDYHHHLRDISRHHLRLWSRFDLKQWRNANSRQRREINHKLEFKISGSQLFLMPQHKNKWKACPTLVLLYSLKIRETYL